MKNPVQERTTWNPGLDPHRIGMTQPISEELQSPALKLLLRIAGLPTESSLAKRMTT